MGLAVTAYPWQAAFVAYCNSAPEDEISQIFSIPLPALKERMTKENWHKLREDVLVNALAKADSRLPTKVEARLAIIQANRDENLKAFTKLREHALEMIGALAERRLKLEKQFFAPKLGTVVRADVDPGPGDWVNIATYLRTIAEGTYRALGDTAPGEKAGSDAPAGTQLPQPPAITIILPGAIASPREDRRLDEAKMGEVIDLREVTEALPPKTT